VDRLVVTLTVLAALVACGPGPARAEPAVARPADLDAVEVYLLTYDVGDEIYTQWGHVTLRVRDAAAGTDLVFDWGVFDFSNPVRFAVKYLVGIPRYRLEVLPYAEMLARYADARRTVWQDRLQLTRSEKARLLERLAWNARPENREYPYDNFDHNCAIKIRDYLDEALAGRIAGRFAGVETTHTLREYVGAALGGRPFVALGLDVLLNDAGEHRVTEWEEFFLPAKMRAHLLTMPASSPSPDPARLRPLLADSTRVLAFPPRTAGRPSGYQLALVTLAPLLAAGAVFHRRPSPVARRWSLRLIGAGVFGVGLLAGALGTLMVFAWTLPDHAVLHHSANLWLFWPVDWIVAAFGFSLALRGRPWSTAEPRGGLIRLLAGAHAAAAAVFILLWAAGLIAQDVGRVAGYLVPLALLTYAAVWRGTVAPQRVVQPRAAVPARSLAA
jgi:hypothetical protein